MYPSLSIRQRFEPVRTLAAGSIAAGYTGVGTVLAHPARLIFIQNLTDALVMFSFDGVNDHFPLPANGFLLEDITSNKTTKAGTFNIAEGDRLYVKQSGVPTTGSVYFSVMYAQEGV